MTHVSGLCRARQTLEQLLTLRQEAVECHIGRRQQKYASGAAKGRRHGGFILQVRFNHLGSALGQRAGMRPMHS